MIDLVTRNSESLFNFFVIYEIEKSLTRFLFPISTGREFVDRLIEFGPGCCREPRCGEFYILLFTDNEGRSEYAHCLQTIEDIFICFTSYLPWFECFHRLLEEVKSKELYKHDQLSILQQFILKLYGLKPPPAEKNAISIPYPLPQTPSTQSKVRNLPMVSYGNCCFWSLIHTFVHSLVRARKFIASEALSHIQTDVVFAFEFILFRASSWQDIRLPIPNPNNPHFLKALEHYYSLEPHQWVDIFTSMLLEKSILFYSKSRQRLTYCIIAAVSLLHPLSCLQAGDDSLFLVKEAKPYITYATRVVDLDGQQIYANVPEEELDNEDVPAPILDFFGLQFSDGSRFLKSAMNTKSHEFASWKTSQLPVQNFLFHQAKPFFAIIVNLLGYWVANDEKIYIIKDGIAIVLSSTSVHIITFFMIVPLIARVTVSHTLDDEFPGVSCYDNDLLKSISFFLVGYFRDCRDSAGHVDFQQMIACQDCPQLKTFLQRLYESQMVHCFLDDRLAKHTVDEFDVQARLLSDKCKERLQQSGSNKPNFGDSRWIECKRPITTNGTINNLRIRRKFGHQFFKLTSKGASKASRSKSEKSSSRPAQKEAANGFSSTPSIPHSRSTNGVNSARESLIVAPNAIAASNPLFHRHISSLNTPREDLSFRMLGHRFTSKSPHFHNSGSAESRQRVTAPVTAYRPIRPQQNARTFTPKTAMATSFSERLPSPVECLNVSQSIPVEGPVRETPITPTTVSPRPPIPPKNFTLLANDKQCHRTTAPPPVPRRNFQNAVPSAPFSDFSSSYSGSFKPPSHHRGTNASPPALPPRRASLQPINRSLSPSSAAHPAPVVMTSFTSVTSTSTKCASSTPDLLDEVGSGAGGIGGSISSESILASSASVRTVESANGRDCGGGGNIDGEAGDKQLAILAFRSPGFISRSNDSCEWLFLLSLLSFVVSFLESIKPRNFVIGALNT
ncbi:unnamed protein product [Hydatigera taeniaeformis]|uniref:DENN domain-containing protein n=1 Tax=Hydatigena taeniaeformis TaxID=6205 RepID=A0A158RDE6_HYDTA|nr:unnamed protein product [Hydatigera taeniaeformis]